MSRKFQATTSRREEICFVTLSGVLDEDNHLLSLRDRMAAKVVVIVLEGVERINERGAEDWVLWLESLQATDTQVVFSACSPAIVNQLNSAASFSCGASIQSFYIPYYCSECDQEKEFLCDASEFEDAPHRPPAAVRCDDCELLMELDDQADFYLSFLRTSPQVSGELYARLKQLETSPEKATRLRSRGAGTLSLGTEGGENTKKTRLPSLASLPKMIPVEEGSPTPEKPRSSSNIVLARCASLGAHGSKGLVISAFLLIALAVVASLLVLESCRSLAH